MTTTADPKSIRYDRITKDYEASYDGQLIGYYPSHLAAEVALDDYALHLAEQGLDRTATELDGGDPYAPLGQCSQCGADAWTTTARGLLCPEHDDVVVLARPAEPAPEMLTGTPIGRSLAIDIQRIAGKWYVLVDGAMVVGCESRQRANQRAIEYRLRQAGYVVAMRAGLCPIDAWDAACLLSARDPFERLPASPTNSVDGVNKTNPEQPRTAPNTGRQECQCGLCTPDDERPFDGRDPRVCQTCHGDGALTGCPTCNGNGLVTPGHDAQTDSPDAVDCAAPTAALYSLIRMTVEEWTDLGVQTPFDRELAALVRALEPKEFRPCPICAGEHAATACPDVTEIKVGWEIWEDYTGDGREALLEYVRWAPAAELVSMARAMDAYIRARFGRSGGVDLILRDWASLAKRNAAPAG